MIQTILQIRQIQNPDLANHVPFRRVKSGRDMLSMLLLLQLQQGVFCRIYNKWRYAVVKLRLEEANPLSPQRQEKGARHAH